MSSLREFFNKAGAKPGVVALGLGVVAAVAAFNGAAVVAAAAGVVTGVAAVVALGSYALDRLSNKPLF